MKIRVYQLQKGDLIILLGIEYRVRAVGKNQINLITLRNRGNTGLSLGRYSQQFVEWIGQKPDRVYSPITIRRVLNAKYSDQEITRRYNYTQHCIDKIRAMHA